MWATPTPHRWGAPAYSFADDEDLNSEQRKRTRWGDPMAMAAAQRVAAEIERPKYRGPPPPPNRFNIAPGYRWDGVGTTQSSTMTRVGRAPLMGQCPCAAGCGGGHALQTVRTALRPSCWPNPTRAQAKNWMRIFGVYRTCRTTMTWARCSVHEWDPKQSGSGVGRTRVVSRNTRERYAVAMGVDPPRSSEVSTGTKLSSSTHWRTDWSNEHDHRQSRARS